MKIVFINDGAYAYASGDPSANGGAERDQWLLGAALARFGWSVTVGVSDGFAPSERKSINGVEFVGIDRGQILLSWYRFLSSERPDWLFWECADYRWGPLVEIAKLLGVRTIFAAGLDREVELRRALLWRAQWWPLYAWGLARTDKIFVQHEGQLLGLPPRWRAKSLVFPKVCILPGVIGDALKIKPHSQREKYVAWVAMLREPKRPDLLIEIARKAPSLRFVVCGGVTNLATRPGYGERIGCELRALPNVQFLGQASPERAQQVIAGAAVLLSTSDEEGFPNTFVQAWSSGTPVVSLKLDPDHLIERHKLGLISGNVDRTLEELSTLLDSPERRAEMGLRGRRFIEDNYSATAVVRLFERAVQGWRQ
jgi:glycosyltransferase involved in cell wall biosynthesis